MPEDRRSQTPITNDLLAYQVSEMREDLGDFRKETNEALTVLGDRLGRSHERLDSRVTDLESWRQSQREARKAVQGVQAGRLSAWQIAGIAASICFGLTGAAIALLAIIATVLVRVLG